MFVPCPDEYEELCKRIWLRLLIISKPYLSSFTHIYPYTRTKIALHPHDAPHQSAPSTPRDSPSPRDSSSQLFPSTPPLSSPSSRTRSPSGTSPGSISAVLRSNLLKLSSRRRSPHRSPSRTPTGSGIVVSGMELPASLQVMLSQLLPHKPRSKTPSPSSSPSGKRKSWDPTDTKIEWDDPELVIYGREKVYSFSGYQLRLTSLLGILYAASRVLKLSLVARDFELSDCHFLST